MNRDTIDSTEEREKLLKHIARFVHDIRTPLFGVGKNTEDATAVSQSLLTATDITTESRVISDQILSSELKQLILSLESIDSYTQKTDEIVNEFWSQTRALLSDPISNINSQPAVQLQAQSIPSNGQKHVLLVDDNELNQQVGLEMLRELGFQVTIANNGLQALDQLESEEFLFVLMDCRLPELDGWETTVEIRKKQSGATIPIIGLTAGLDECDFNRAFDAGMNDCLSKPLTIDALERIVDIYVG